MWERRRRAISFATLTSLPNPPSSDEHSSCVIPRGTWEAVSEKGWPSALTSGLLAQSLRAQWLWNLDISCVRPSTQVILMRLFKAAEMWMDLESAIQTEVSQKNKYHIFMHIYWIQKYGIGGLICRAGPETQRQRTTIWTLRGEGGEGKKWRLGSIRLHR